MMKVLRVLDKSKKNILIKENFDLLLIFGLFKFLMIELVI